MKSLQRLPRSRRKPAHSVYREKKRKSRRLFPMVPTARQQDASSKSWEIQAWIKYVITLKSKISLVSRSWPMTRVLRKYRAGGRAKSTRCASPFSHQNQNQNGPEKRRSSITFNDDPESGPSEGHEVSTKKLEAPHERHIFLVDRDQYWTFLYCFYANRDK